MWTCVPSASGMNEIVDCPPFPTSHLLFLLRSVILLAYSLNDSRCMPAIVCMYYWIFQGTLSISHKVVSNFCHPMDCSLPGSSVHGVLQARILEWVVISLSKGSSQPSNRTQVSCIPGRFFTYWTTYDRRPPRYYTVRLKMFPVFLCVCLLCIICVKSTISPLQYSTI